jgi:hypothetical protein
MTQGVPPVHPAASPGRRQGLRVSVSLCENGRIMARSAYNEVSAWSPVLDGVCTPCFALFGIELSVYRCKVRRCTMLGFFTNFRGPAHGGYGGIYILVYAAVLVRGTRSAKHFVLIRVCFRYCKD